MEFEKYRETVHGLMEAICSQSFGSWEFFALWVLGILEIFFFGFVFVRGLGKSERNFILIFTGNIITVILMILAGALLKDIFEERVEEAWVITTLMWIAAVWCAFIWIIIFAKVFWGTGRITTMVAVVFTLAVSYGGMWVGDRVITLLDKAEDDMGYYQEKQEQATDAIKKAVD